MEKTETQPFQKESMLLYTTIPRRLASFFIDAICVNLIFLLALYLLNQLYKVNVLERIYVQYFNASTPTTTTTLDTQIFFGYVLLFALYNFFMLFIFQKSIGMLVTNTQYTASDKNGNPTPLSIPQTFLRGFICSILGFFFLFIPAVVWPFDPYNRSLNDRISSTFPIQLDKSILRDIISYLIIFIVIIPFFVVNFIGK